MTSHKLNDINISRYAIQGKVRSLILRVVLGCGVLPVVIGCSISDLVNKTALPANVRDPSVIKNEAGALGAYRQSIVALTSAMGAGSIGTAGRNSQSYVIASGLFTDEFQELLGSNLDLRKIDEDVGGRGLADDQYYLLQIVRGSTREATGALRKYNPKAPVALQGHLFAIEGISEVLLAELFCSGIPLSTVDFEREYTITAGFTTDEVYAHALALFDSATRLATDSAKFIHFASLGRARALLGLGRIAEAAQAVSAVPNNYQYLLTYASNRPKFVPKATEITVGNREGMNGLPFGSYQDPRTTLAFLTNPTAPLILASGVEARLIEAEADLLAGQPDWLTKLNALRTTCTSASACPTPAPAGIGGVAGLSPLEDPALQPLPPGKDSTAVRVDLLFAERAYWLFLTGHRQGDLRRLVRHYGRPQATVYPTGAWGPQQLVLYGDDVTVSLPPSERQRNPLYTGCFNRDA